MAVVPPDHLIACQRAHSEAARGTRWPGQAERRDAKKTPGPPSKVGPDNEPTLAAGRDVVKQAELSGGAATTC
jgi:hypothetical protein